MSELNGKCLCGSVSVRANPQHEQVDICHCSMCRKWTAGPFLAFGCGEDVSFDGEDNISVYKSSEWGERLFCKSCGTSLAWRLQDGSGEYHVSSQLFDENAEFPLKLQIFIDEKPKNYNFAEQTATMTSAEVLAMFAPDEDKAV